MPSSYNGGQTGDGLSPLCSRGDNVIMALHEGDKAPDFTLPTDSGETLRLSDLSGRKVILYFFPKANTPG